MKEVRIAKDKLVTILKKNLMDHLQTFLAAQEGYRVKAIEVLDEQLRLARDGAPFELRRVVELVAPENHERDYERALEMLELSEDHIITLSTADFANLVQDSWGWSRSWAMSNSPYTDSPKLRSLREEE